MWVITSRGRRTTSKPVEAIGEMVLRMTRLMSNQGTLQPPVLFLLGEDPDPGADFFFVHSRWWFTGSVFPMMAGILGPVASAFSICALVRPWRQLGYPGSDVGTAEFVDDPVWSASRFRYVPGSISNRRTPRLITVNAIQLVLALVANFFLLFNMARRIPFTVAQPITITGW